MTRGLILKAVGLADFLSAAELLGLCGPVAGAKGVPVFFRDLLSVAWSLPPGSSMWNNRYKTEELICLL